jgi:hypothetical protein
MSADYSIILTDLALLGHRNRPVKALLFKVRPGTTGKPAKPVKPSHTAALVGLLSKALDQKLARKISGKQFKRIRHRIDRAIKHAT